MESLPQDFFALCMVVFLLGLKHGFDADHLAAIDGLTRFNQRERPGLARYCGVLFSLGHGAVVIGVALAVSALSTQWHTPEWLGTFGAWISIGFLVALGALNIHAVLRTPPTAHVSPVGLKGRLLGRLVAAGKPGLVAGIGALFALSFDTVSQAALFALASMHFGGWQHAVLLGMLFMFGMLGTDGINGFWISRLIGRADRLALVASRVMSLVVGGSSLLIAAFGAAKLWFPAVDAWGENKAVLVSSSLIALILGSYLVAVWLTRPGRAGLLIRN